MFENINTPAYIIDEKRLRENLEILHSVEEASGAHILLAQKAFSNFAFYPLIAKYISGTTASGIYEARLGKECMGMEGSGKETHVFAPAFKREHMEELVEICDHIIFNSINQLEAHRSLWEGKTSVGLRINPEFRTQEGHDIYDPCAPGSRLGITRANFPKELPMGVEGLHFHTLCEQNSDDLVSTFKAFEEVFGSYLKSEQIKWLNMGGGHHITREDYDREALIELVRYIRETYQVEVYLEPGEAIALNAGYLVTTVMDIVENGMQILILDASAACHMPDVLEMPYRPPLRGGFDAGEKPFTYRLSSLTCLAGDRIGDYSFEEEKKVGDRLVFEDMAIYSMVKNNTFNGIPLPDIDVLTEDGEVKVLKNFGYEDFKERLG